MSRVCQCDCHTLRGSEEVGCEGVVEEGVAQDTLIYHEECVGETDPSEIVGI